MLLLLICVGAAGVVVSTVRRDLADSSVMSAPKEQRAAFRSMGRIYAAIDGGQYFCVLVGLIFFTALLCHPDVVKSFNSPSHDGTDI